MVDFKNSWNLYLKDFLNSSYYLNLRNFLKFEYSNYTVYPDMNNIFNCLMLTPFEKVKAVIIGQDPYHNKGQAMGLSFSVPNGVKLPPSLQNIFKELFTDLNIKPTLNGDLTKWAKQGVLLLNNVLTVRENLPNSHKNKGWELFTDFVIKTISNNKQNVVFILWGSNAKQKKHLIDSSKHLVLECAHPSPLSAYNGFFGCKHFSKTNNYLVSKNIEPIDWNLID